MSYAPGTGEGYVGSFNMADNPPACPDDPEVLCARVGSTTHSWRCPQCGLQFQLIPNATLSRLPVWVGIFAFVPKGKSEAWE